ncbi:MAG TPA: peptidylprolyl isomerase [Anaerolineaceae bacterium]|nr:peptidylprolyl isomerase [Anaerolineaceae bacterium]
MEYELTVDGEVIDATEAGDPIDFIQGYENIIAGLEKAVDGMAVGDSKEVFVKAVDAYGEYDADGFVEVPKAEFPEDIPMEVGVEISVTNDDGEEMTAFIEEVSVETITLNFNHPLAGKDLTFKVKIVGIREATAEELEHGHIHYDDHECGENCTCGGEECTCGGGECSCGNH